MRSIVLALTLAGCASLAPVNAFTPWSGFTRTTDLAYGSLKRQKLDVYVPETSGPEAKPIVVFFHGGAWQYGSKDEYRFAGQALSSAGFVTVIPNYRLYPEVKFPSFVEDAALAVTWARSHAAEFGGDPQLIFLMGHSAGAHIAAMLALDERFGQTNIAGFIGLAGPYDFLPVTDPTNRIILGPDFEASQPIRFADGHPPPMLLLHGTGDETVGIHNSRNLAKRARELHGKVTLTEYDGWGHVRILLALASPLRDLGPVLEDTATFVRTISKASPAECPR